ncbi:MAG: DUF1080 domain-containing protein [Chloroflexi bacterium]|nr:DUF1080 domain-containing protein [Chloroflexota bacterium]
MKCLIHPFRFGSGKGYLHAVSLALLAGSSLFLAPAAEDTAKQLFNGRDLTGWRKPAGEWTVAARVSSEAADPKKFTIQPGTGVLVNGPNGRTVNLISESEHGDVEAHIEFVVPKGSNSGIYFQARYEIQVFDSWGVEKPSYSDCGGIYERWKDDKGFEGHAPRLNASRPPGEWQTFDVVFRAPRFDGSGKKVANARFVKVTHNGRVIHENVELTGPTRAATYENDEKPAGPLMLQGDHGPVAYRNLQLKALKLD